MQRIFILNFTFIIKDSKIKYAGPQNQKTFSGGTETYRFVHGTIIQTIIVPWFIQIGLYFIWNFKVIS